MVVREAQQSEYIKCYRTLYIKTGTMVNLGYVYFIEMKKRKEKEVSNPNCIISNNKNYSLLMKTFPERKLQGQNIQW